VVFSSNTDLLLGILTFPVLNATRPGGKPWAAVRGLGASGAGRWGSSSGASGTICLPALRQCAAFSTPARDQERRDYAPSSEKAKSATNVPLQFAAPSER